MRKEQRYFLCKALIARLQNPRLERKHIMSNSSLLSSFILCLAISATACAGNAPTPGVANAAYAAATEASEQSTQDQSLATTVQSFTAVEGADLAARLEAASQRARSKSSSYWSAYSFDVRPGVAIDPGVREFHGSMNTIGDTAVFVGTTAS